MIDAMIEDERMVFLDTEGGDIVTKIPGLEFTEEEMSELRNVNQLIELAAIQTRIKDDTETYEDAQWMCENGVDKVTPKTPVAIFRQRGRGGLKLFSSRCKPPTDIPPDSSACHGCRWEDLEEYPSYQDSNMIGEFAREFNDAVWVIHNPDYDIPVIDWHAKHAGIYCKPAMVIDTVRLARRILAGNCPNNRLGTLLHYFKCPRMSWHLAFPDAVTSAMVFGHLYRLYREAGGGPTLFDLARFIYRPALQERMMFGKFRGKTLEEVDTGYLGWYFNPEQRGSYNGYRNLDMEYTMMIEYVRREGMTEERWGVLSDIVTEYYQNISFPIGVDVKEISSSFLDEIS